MNDTNLKILLDRQEEIRLQKQKNENLLDKIASPTLGGSLAMAIAGINAPVHSFKPDPYAQYCPHCNKNLKLTAEQQFQRRNQIQDPDW